VISVTVPSSSTARQPEQDRLDPLVHLGLLGQPELAEDAVDVLLDRLDGKEQRARDRRVVLAGGHLRHDLLLAGGQSVQCGASAAGPDQRDRATQLTGAVPGARLITVDGPGHPASFIQDTCLAQTTAAYLIDLRMPAAGTVRTPDAIPFA
jgi:hypothetical protein